jgi:hypothetical protein
MFQTVLLHEQTIGMEEVKDSLRTVTKVHSILAHQNLFRQSHSPLFMNVMNVVTSSGIGMPTTFSRAIHSKRAHEIVKGN